MRLLVLDESPFMMGGVDTVRCTLLPALALQVEKLVWACAVEHTWKRLDNTQFEHVDVMDLHPPSRSARGLARAVLRRLPKRLTPWRDSALGWLSHSHLRQICRRHNLTHVLEICVHRQPFPHLDRPTAGLVHDLDYADRGVSPIDGVFCDWMKNAVRLSTNSTQTRAQLLELDASAGPRLEVVLLGSPPVQAPPHEAANPWARREPVLYYPSAAKWYKGHHVLLAALVKLAAAGLPFHCYFSGSGTDLIFDEHPTGEKGTNDVRLNCFQFREAVLGRVTLLGQLPWPAVEQLYQAANVVVLPTTFEGFRLAAE